MDAPADPIASRLEDTRQRLLKHAIYRRVAGPEALRTFLESHVFAVWDFMSLLKRLQRELTCVDLPWRPVGDPEVRFLINEIVCGEESDLGPDGAHTSHFELYLRAMREAGADPSAIDGFLAALAAGQPTAEALEGAGVPAGVRRFTGFTLGQACGGALHEVAAAFTYGREDVIPEMFLPLVDTLVGSGRSQFGLLKFYLERHIALDGGHHGQLARRMIARLCGTDPTRWIEAADAAEAALRERIALWDAILDRLPAR
ncbi:MAG: DUF3050 domain-containing protein [Verrucomicrobia bacterium]|nr:DUF3050 domain-containing protein [Verrucomicrobiota bacterium]